jgi:hypothetical protein
MSVLSTARAAYHAALLDKLLVLDDNGVPSNADKSQTSSRFIATQIATALGAVAAPPLSPQTAGDEFERITAAYINGVFPQLDHLRPGNWRVEWVRGRSSAPIAKYEQYSHLAEVEQVAREHPELRVILGSDYNIASDIIVSRAPEPDAHINVNSQIVDDLSARRSVLRESYGGAPILHACISCKWTMRSDRAQNARSEALNLIRARKGRLPHIIVVTAEPTPSRLASLALGTGDIDCVYHFALPELMLAVEALGQSEAVSLLELMIEGKRIKDISDLPLDLAT